LLAIEPPEITTKREPFRFCQGSFLTARVFIESSNSPVPIHRFIDSSIRRGTGCSLPSAPLRPAHAKDPTTSAETN
jgi:hypothetical protein